ncbi:glycine receptor subunit alphaZ1 isoform X1 [Parasteatoda tepidariorum]
MFLWSSMKLLNSVIDSVIGSFIFLLKSRMPICHFRLFLYLNCVFIEVFLIKSTKSQCSCEEKENYLILPGYNKNNHPNQDEGKPTTVYFSLDIMDIDEITEERMEYSMQFYINEYWKDLRLNYSSMEVGSHIPRELHNKIWKPDTIFEDSKGGWIYQLSVPNDVIQVHKYGYLHHYARYNMKLACSMLLYTFPMDTQLCYMNITSLANSNKHLIFKWIEEREEENAGVSNMYIAKIQPLKYCIISAEPTTRKLVWPLATYSGLGAKFRFVRYLSSHIFNVYLPSGLIVVLSFLSFWLNVRSVPARVALGLTSLLTLSTQASQARSHLPPINYLTALDIWLFACMMLVFLSLLEYSIVYSLYSKKIQDRKRHVATAWSDIRSNSVVSPQTLTKKAEVKKKQLSANNASQNEPLGPDFEEETQLLDKICRFLFPLCFLVFSLAYWINYLSINP